MPAFKIKEIEIGTIPFTGILMTNIRTGIINSTPPRMWVIESTDGVIDRVILMSQYPMLGKLRFLGVFSVFVTRLLRTDLEVLG